MMVKILRLFLTKGKCISILIWKAEAQENDYTAGMYFSREK